MSQTPLSLAGFQAILIGRFWVIAEAKKGVRPKSIEDLGTLPRKKQDLSEYIDAARLTELQLTCFSLRLERGLSIADIARLLGRDRKTIQEHIESAKKRIDVTRMKERLKKRSARSGME
jgi:DNA-binding NarL/FixJ family response regulator